MASSESCDPKLLLWERQRSNTAFTIITSGPAEAWVKVVTRKSHAHSIRGEYYDGIIVLDGSVLQEAIAFYVTWAKWTASPRAAAAASGTVTNLDVKCLQNFKHMQRERASSPLTPV